MFFTDYNKCIADPHYYKFAKALLGQQLLKMSEGLIGSVTGQLFMTGPLSYPLPP